MKMQIDWKRIEQLASAYCRTGGKRQVAEAVDKVMFGIDTPPGGFDLYDVGDVFAAVLWKSIQEANLPIGVEELLANIVVEEPQKIGGGKYSVTVTFADDLGRETMSTLKTYYTINLAKLYNNGVDHLMKEIWETHNGFLSVSNPDIPRTDFVEHAIKNFLSKYKKKYNIVDVEHDFDQ